MAIAEPKTRRWTVAEYHRAAERGIFDPEERLELIEGEILTMSLQKERHSTASQLVEDALRDAFGQGFTVRVQKPLTRPPYSEPEPDVAVVAGGARDYLRHHPDTALLVVEVADASLDHDRKRKIPLYAQAAIPDYWILNLRDSMLEVYRDPDPEAAKYRESVRLSADQIVSPLAAPEATIVVRDLLP